MFALSALLIFLVMLFVVIQIKTLFFDLGYLKAIIYMSVIVLCSATVAITAFNESSDLITTHLLITIASLLCLILFSGLLVAKIFLRDNWLQPSRRLLRTPTDMYLDLKFSWNEEKHEYGTRGYSSKFTVRTSDNVDIRGYHLKAEIDGRHRRSVVIIAHGGFRSKDLLIKAMLASWLFHQFDVVAFDFRGHGESGGVWTGDGKTVADLKAVIRHCKELGYEKIGVYGRSMGGWTAILEAADNHDIDAIVTAGMPPGYYSEVPEFLNKTNVLKIPGVSFLVRVLLNVRFAPFDDVRSPMHPRANPEIGKVAPVPVLILFNQADPGAGVTGEQGFWEREITKKRESGKYRNVRKPTYDANSVYDAACAPKELVIMPGKLHVYGLESTRSLFLNTEHWFERYLLSDPFPSEFVRSDFV